MFAWQEAGGNRDKTCASASRGAGSENFPVASCLVAPHLRAQVLAFYAFARAADDIADAPDVPQSTKLEQLSRFESGLDGAQGAPQAVNLRRAVAGNPVLTGHARKLLCAFRADAGGGRCATWDDLLAYCSLSAIPVGRFLLDLHGENAEAARYCDPLCVALQVLNHLQDLRQDHDDLGRVYLPQDFLTATGATPADLSRPALTGAARRAVDRTLDECDALLTKAAPLARAVQSRGLRGQAAATHRLAMRLAARLRRQDPLAGRVALSRLDFAAAGLAGLRAAVAGRG